MFVSLGSQTKKGSESMLLHILSLPQCYRSTLQVTISLVVHGTGVDLDKLTPGIYTSSMRVQGEPSPTNPF